MISLNEDASRDIDGLHIQYGLSVLLREAINNKDYDLVKKSLVLAYKQINNMMPEVYTSSELNKDIETINSLSTDVNDYTSESDTENDSWEDSDAQVLLDDTFNEVISSFFDTCDSLGVYVCSRNDKYKDEQSDKEQEVSDVNDLLDNNEEIQSNGNDF